MSHKARFAKTSKALFLSCAGLAALTTAPIAFAHSTPPAIPPCVGSARSASCDLVYTTADGAQGRQLLVSTSVGVQNPLSPERCVPPYLGFRAEAILSGTYQQSYNLFAGNQYFDPAGSSVTEDLENGKFSINGMRYSPGQNERYGKITEFPRIEISFRGTSQQDVIFTEDGVSVTAVMSCQGRENVTK